MHQNRYHDKQEPPYDVFICYAATDSFRSNLNYHSNYNQQALQDLVDRLTNKGYRVFVSDSTIRRRADYNVYVSGVLSKVKLMLIYGSAPNDIQRVKNEWTAYQRLIETGKKQPNSLLVACIGFAPEYLPRDLQSAQCFTDKEEITYSKQRVNMHIMEKIDEILQEKKRFSASACLDNAKKNPRQSVGSLQILKNKFFYCVLGLLTILCSRFVPMQTVWPQILMGFGFSVLFITLTFIVNRKENALWLLLYTVLFTVLPAVQCILLICGIKAYTLFLILLFVSVSCLSATFFFKYMHDEFTVVSFSMCIVSLISCVLEAILLSALTISAVASQVYIGAIFAVWAIWMAILVIIKNLESFYIVSFTVMLILAAVIGILWLCGVTTLVFLLSVLFTGLFTVFLYYAMLKGVDYSYALGPIGLSVYMIVADILAAILFSPLVTHIVIGALFTAYLVFATLFSIRNNDVDAYLIYFVMNIVALGLFILASFFLHAVLIVYTAALTIAGNLLTQRNMLQIITLPQKNTDICKLLSFISICGNLLLAVLIIALG